MTNNNRKLGKKAPRMNLRTPFLANYLRSFVAKYPSAVDWGREIKDWPMFGNDRIGLCTLAAAAYADMVWTQNVAGTPAPFNNDEIVSAYVAVTASEGAAYDPLTGENDNGAVEDDVLKLWRDKGIAGMKILGWATINTRDLDSIRYAIATFGCVYSGVALPLSAEDQLERGHDWILTGRHDRRGLPGSWGGHAICWHAYDEEFFTCSTWSKRQRASNAWLAAYADEMHVPVSEEWINSGTGLSPSGLNLADLYNDLKALGQAG